MRRPTEHEFLMNMEPKSIWDWYISCLFRARLVKGSAKAEKTPSADVRSFNSQVDCTQDRIIKARFSPPTEKCMMKMNGALKSFLTILTFMSINYKQQFSFTRIATSTICSSFPISLVPPLSAYPTCAIRQGHLQGHFSSHLAHPSRQITSYIPFLSPQ